MLLNDSIRKTTCKFFCLALCSLSYFAPLSPARAQQVSPALASPASPLTPAPVSTQPAQEVTAVEKLKDENGLQIKIYATQPVQYEVKTLRNPFRIIVDIPGKLIAKETSMELDEGVLKEIRFAQFGKNPDVVRFVIDCEREIYYRVAPDEDKKTLTIHFSPQIYAMLWEKAEDVISVTLHASGPLHFSTHELLEPPRVAVDLTPAFLALPQTEYEMNLDALSKVRASQFNFEPDTVRLVFDFTRKISYTITTSQDRTLINLKFFLAAQAPPAISLSFPKGIKIMVDAGHGGKDRGAKSPNGLIEKYLNLDMAQTLYQLLLEAGIDAVMMRDGDDTLELYSRPKRANAEPVHVFVSIHCNSLPSKRDIRGSEVYYYNSAESKELAQDVLKALTEQAGTPARYVKSSNFVVVKYTAMPSILVEVGYFTNPADEVLLANENFRKNAALGIFRGLQVFLSKHTKEELEAYFVNSLPVKEQMLIEKLMPAATGTLQP